MKFSFVVPVWKKPEAILRKCLKSLGEQSYKNIEVICSFDGPDLELEKVANECGAKVLVNEHKGACAARNAGLDLATGDYVVFWDADCVAEPNMVNAWVAYLKATPDAHFVYSGYKWTDPTLPAFDSESFDPWLLSKYNYIAPMFPVKREMVVRWDESLSGLQDWDYWRRVVANGAKGVYMPTGGVAYPFATELPDKNSISGQPDKVKERIETVRAKHNDASPDILVLSGRNKPYAVELAKILDADYFAHPGYWRIRSDYKAILFLGFDFETKFLLDTHLDLPGKKIVYWMGADAEYIFNEAPAKLLKQIKEHMDRHSIVNLCSDKFTLDLLDQAGIKAEIVNYPARFNVFDAPLPEQFKVLAYSDEDYAPLLDSIIKAMPDVVIDRVQPGKAFSIKDYTVNLQFTDAKRLIPATRNMLLAGRHVISNVQEPYCGYVSVEQDIDQFKDEIINQIRAIKAKPELNVEARDHYRAVTDPVTFQAEIRRVVEGGFVNV